LVREMLDHLEQSRIGSEEVVAEIGPALDEIFLVLTVGDFAHAADQQAVTVVLNQAVPVTAPDDLDDVPTCAAENGFELLNDLSVATNRAIEPLQVAVHHEDQIVEAFARGQRDGTERLGLVHFAVAEKCPYLAAGGFLQSPIFQIL